MELRGAFVSSLLTSLDEDRDAEAAVTQYWAPRSAPLPALQHAVNSRAPTTQFPLRSQYFDRALTCVTDNPGFP